MSSKAIQNSPSLSSRKSIESRVSLESWSQLCVSLSLQAPWKWWKWILRNWFKWTSSIAMVRKWRYLLKKNWVSDLTVTPVACGWAEAVKGHLVIWVGARALIYPAIKNKTFMVPKVFILRNLHQLCLKADYLPFIHAKFHGSGSSGLASTWFWVKM